jgi:hypothetical protein
MTNKTRLWNIPLIYSDPTLNAMVVSMTFVVIDYRGVNVGVTLISSNWLFDIVYFMLQCTDETN